MPNRTSPASTFPHDATPEAHRSRRALRWATLAALLLLAAVAASRA